MSEEHELVEFRADGPVVRFDPQAKMWSLTEMHQAAGANPSKEPSRWLRGAQAQELITALSGQLNRRNSPIWTAEDLVQARRGNDGGTWAHWQIAAAYAHYLDPHFYLQWNEWAMERVTGGAQPAPAQLAALESRLAAVEAQLAAPVPFADGRRVRRRDGAGQVVVRRVTERTTEEITLDGVPARPLTEAIRAALRQAERRLRPIEITALLQAAGVPVTHPVQVSSALWHMRQAGEVQRDDAGRYALAATEGE